MEELIRQLGPCLSHSAYGYLIIFGLLMLGMLWVPFPEETFLATIGVFVSRDCLYAVPAAAAAFLGTTVGVTCMFFVGRSAGFAVIRRFGKLLRITPRDIRRTRDWFDRRGKWTLTFGYWIPYVRHINAMAAGTTKVRYGEFALYAYPGGLAWVIAFISLGYFLGEQWERIEKTFNPAARLLAGIVVAGIVIFFVVRHFRRKKKRA